MGGWQERGMQSFHLFNQQAVVHVNSSLSIFLAMAF
jgi:hypothetical protein